MASLSSFLKDVLNGIAGRFNVRLVNRNWGPKGYIDSFSQLRRLGFKPNIIFDVGASDGTWSVELANIFPHANYFLFEPLPECQSKLENLVKTRSNFRYFDCALGACDAVIDFNQHAGQSSFFASPQWLGKKTRVSVHPLDELLSKQSIPWPDLLKADIQGYELEMLKGAGKCLENCSFLLLELSWLQIYEGGCTAGEVMGYLAERGFHVFDICSYSMRPLDNRLVQSDVLFAHERTGLFKDKRWTSN